MINTNLHSPGPGDAPHSATPAAAAILPASEHSSAGNLLARLIGGDRPRERLHAVRQSGTLIDEYGLVLPIPNREVLNRVAIDFDEVRSRVMDAIVRGKHVLYAPGSYDLVHVGHASWIQEGTSQYLTHRPGLQRKDLFVVMLCDDDELIWAVKPPHLRSETGQFPRPNQKEGLFRHLTSLNPRLVECASIDGVDLAGFMPSPSHAHTILRSPTFQTWFRECAALESFPRQDLIARASPGVSRILAQYRTLVSDIAERRFNEVVFDFERAKYDGLGYEAGTAKWRIETWQLLLHRYLGHVSREPREAPFVRAISEHDTKYKDVVAEIMALCGIGHLMVNDETVVSTTDLIKAFSIRDLLRAKQLAYAPEVFRGLR